MNEAHALSCVWMIWWELPTHISGDEHAFGRAGGGATRERVSLGSAFDPRIRHEKPEGVKVKKPVRFDEICIPDIPCFMYIILLTFTVMTYLPTFWSSFN